MGETGLRGDEVGHDVERVADHDDDRVGRVLLHVVGHIADDFGVLEEEVVAAHARLARQTAGDDDDVRARVIGGIVRALDVAVEVFQAGRLQHVEGLALRHALDDVVQDDVAQFLFGQALRCGSPDKTGSDDTDLHGILLFRPPG